MPRSEIPGKGERGGSSPPSIEVIQKRPSQTREIFEMLRLAIARRDLAPGNMYSVAELAEWFGVSRTPVREALIDLSSRGVVRFERNRGVRILQSTVHDLEEIFQLRLMLEVPATRIAVKHMSQAELGELRGHVDQLRLLSDSDSDLSYWRSDRAFHRVLMHATRNERLADFVETLRDVTLVRGATTAGRARTLHDITAEHGLILEFAEKRNADGAAAAMAQHIQTTADLLIRQESG